jgi:Ribbon-helix-helix protein, copG family
MGEIEYKLLVGFDDDLKAKLHKKTRESGISMSQFIRNCIEAQLTHPKTSPSYEEIFWLFVSVTGFVWLLRIY